MPNDAKCGLVVGVGLVIAVAIVFFQRDSSSRSSAAIAPPAHAVQPSTNADPAEPASLPEESLQSGGGEDRTLIHQPVSESPSSRDPWKPIK